ncbi:MAG: hypothetical protein JW986_03050 [Methanotrichaceae archaeon]|nr:hypothetical protein [Methanotrichaceae archaeon]
MKRIALTMMLIMAMGLVSQGYPLVGGNGVVNCTVFGAFKSILPLDHENKNVIMNVDMGLVGLDGNPVLANYTMVDGNDRIYGAIRGYCRDVQPGRRILGFVVPREAVIKTVRVEPVEGAPFTIEWPDLPEANDGDVYLRYYGAVEKGFQVEKGSVTLDVGLTNNLSYPLPISPENFSLEDQWGWRYVEATGFSPHVLGPNESGREWITFDPISPLSRPARLEFRCATDRSLWIQIGDTVDMVDAISESSRSGCSICDAAEPVDPNSPKGRVAATRERLAMVKGNIS